MAQERSHRSEPHYFVAGLVMITVLVVGALVSLTPSAADSTRPDRSSSNRTALAGDGARRQGQDARVTIGSVSKVSTDGDTASLTLDIDDKSFAEIPAGTKAQIKASTAFGAKYVALLPEGRGTISSGATIESVNVATEVNTLFENLLGVMQAVDPAKLNATLGAVAGVCASAAANSARPSAIPTRCCAASIRCGGRSSATPLTTKVTDVYNSAAGDLLDLLDNATVTATTVRDNEHNLDGLLTSAIGLGNSGTNLLRASGSRFVNASRLLVPTTELLAKYSPEFKCVADQATYNLDYGMGRFGGKNNGYSLDLDVALLLGDNAYRYPDNLPKGECQGRAQGFARLLLADHADQLSGAVSGDGHRCQHRLRHRVKAGTPAFIQYMVGQITSGVAGERSRCGNQIRDLRRRDGRDPGDAGGGVRTVPLRRRNRIPRRIQLRVGVEEGREGPGRRRRRGPGHRREGGRRRAGAGVVHHRLGGP